MKFTGGEEIHIIDGKTNVCRFIRDIEERVTSAWEDGVPAHLWKDFTPISAKHRKKLEGSPNVDVPDADTAGNRRSLSEECAAVYAVTQAHENNPRSRGLLRRRFVGDTFTEYYALPGLTVEVGKLWRLLDILAAQGISSVDVADLRRYLQRMAQTR